MYVKTHFATVNLTKQLGREDRARWSKPGVFTAKAKHVVGILVHDRQVVRNEKHSQILIFLKPPYQLVELLLTRFVNACSRLIE